MHEADLDAMTGLLGDPRVMWVYPRPWTRDEVDRWIRRNESEYRERGFGLWIVEERETGAFVGECGLTQQAFAGSAPRSRSATSCGRSSGVAASRPRRPGACVAFARDVARLARIVALIDPRNDASKRVAAKNGLRWERDVAVPGKTLGVYAIDFGEPRAVP